MTFPSDVVGASWRIVGGKCESCRKPLDFGKRGKEGEGAWEPVYADGDSENNAIANCKILCLECRDKAK